MVVGRANSEGDINVDSEDDLEPSELSKVINSPYQKNQPIATMLPPYYNNHGLLQQHANDLSQQSHISLSHLHNSSQTLNNSLHQIHQRSSSQNSQDSGGEINNHNNINNSISNHKNHPESNESCNSEGDSESLTSNVQDEKDIIDQECDTKNDDELSSKNDNKKEPGELPEEVFGSKADLQLHTQIHMREAKPYKCTQCNKAFANSSYLSQHTRIHLGIKPYKCEICQRKFTQLSHLQQHIRTHTGDKPYKCRHPGCTKAFSQLSNLQSHSRCHQTDKPYKCNSCYKCFVDETALLEHIPKHKESKHLKTHICQYCGKSYTQETYLAKHMQKHTDRPDKRPSLVAPGLGGNAGAATGNGAAPSSGNPSQNQQSQNSAVSSALAAGLAGMPVSQGSQLTAADYHWPKMDPAAAAYAAGVHERDYGLLDPRLNPHAARDMSDPRHHMEDLRAHSQFVGTGNGNVGYDHTGGNAGNIKTSSAFSPIQGSMLHQYSAASQFMGRSGGGFFDPLSYPKHHSQVGFDSKPGGTNSFPNQLISLSQIRNYAHQPDMLHSLKEKVTQ